MKQTAAAEAEGDCAKLKQGTPPPPPPVPPRFCIATRPAAKTIITASVTNQQIAKFWRQKRMEEEDHLLAAIKAAARIRARKLSKDDYKRFVESLKEDDDSKENNGNGNGNSNSSGQKDENDKELRVGIKDWWTKSKYAYLNQPAIGSMDAPKRQTTTYIPNFCNYKAPPPPTTSFGIF